VLDLALTGMDFLAFMVVIFGITLFMYEELEMKAAILLLSKPLRRHEYLLGHYLGLLMSVAANLVFMLVILCLAMLYAGGGLTPLDLLAVLYIFYKGMLVGALAMLFASFCSSVPLALLLTVFLQLLGHFSFHLHALGRQITSIPVRLLLDGLYFILPNYYWLDVRGRAGLPGFEMSSGYFINSSLYVLCYSALLMFLAVLLFRRREF
jgi:ABC-type transport system involved in multi-copper enzyme maturation permease subunit